MESNIFILARKSINDIKSKIDIRGADEKFSVRIVLLSTFILVLKRYSDDEEFLIKLSSPDPKTADVSRMLQAGPPGSGNGQPANSRPAALVESGSGLLKVRIPNDPTFTELAQDISKVVRVMFTLDGQFKGLFAAKELKISLVEGSKNKGGIKFLMIPSNEDPIVAKIDYKTDISDPDFSWMMKQHYLNLLNEIVVDPGKRISKYTILSNDELNKILYEWNKKEAWFPYHDRLIHLFKKSDEVLAAPQPEKKRASAKRRIYILDKNMNCMPVGCPGTLYISREGIGPGSYMLEPKLAAKKFIRNPLVPNEIIYNTGNMARWLPDGSIDFPDTREQKAKERKFGITIEEIESVICAYPQIGECKIAVKEDARHEKTLVAFVVMKEQRDHSLDSGVIRKFLEERLPDYFIPAEFIVVSKIPEIQNNRIEYDV